MGTRCVLKLKIIRSPKDFLTEYHVNNPNICLWTLNTNAPRIYCSLIVLATFSVASFDSATRGN